MAGRSRRKRPRRSADPLLRRVESEAEPTRQERIKEKPGDQPQDKGQAAPQGLHDVLRGGPVGVLRILGPGLVTGASDDDPSGVGTYSQVGAQFGYGLLWTALFTFPLMSAVQELCGRIALQTGLGLGVSLRRKFPIWIVATCVAGLLVANTINIGADLGAIAAGGALLSGGRIDALWLVLPAALLVLGLQLFATYELIFNIFKWLTLALFAYVITAFFTHADVGRVLAATFIPHFEASTAFLGALVAVLGTTISPYLFFWQASSEVDEMEAAGLTSEAARRGVKRSELRAARLDIFTGMLFSNLVMYFIILTTATVLHEHGKTDITTAAEAASALEPLAGPFASLLFAAGLIGTGLLAVPILSGSAAYAVKELLRLPGGLHDRPRYRPVFYIVIVVATLIGVAFNFLHVDPIRALFITALINGILAPPVLILIVLLGSDRTVMGNRVSGRLSLALTWTAALLMTLAAVTLIVISLPLGR